MWPLLLPMHNWEPAGWGGNLHNKDNLVSKLPPWSDLHGSGYSWLFSLLVSQSLHLARLNLNSQPACRQRGRDSHSGECALTEVVTTTHVSQQSSSGGRASLQIAVWDPSLDDNHTAGWFPSILCHYIAENTWPLSLLWTSISILCCNDTFRDP